MVVLVSFVVLLWISKHIVILLRMSNHVVVLVSFVVLLWMSKHIVILVSFIVLL